MFMDVREKERCMFIELCHIHKSRINVIVNDNKFKKLLIHYELGHEIFIFGAFYD